MSNRMKCIVHKCSNHTDEGKFIGAICVPCFTYITSGEIGFMDSFLGGLRSENRSLLSILERMEYAIKMSFDRHGCDCTECEQVKRAVSEFRDWKTSTQKQ